MNLARLPVIREWVLSWLILGRNKLYVLASSLVDLIFFIAFGFMTGPVYDKLTEHVIIIGSLVSQQLRAPGRARPAIIDVLFQPPVSSFTWKFFLLLLLLAVVVFVIYCLFHGLNWWMATSLTTKKTHWREYMMSFARVNALWFGLFMVWYCIDTIFDLRRLVLEKALDQPAPGAAIVLNIILGIIVYFAIVSYPLLSIKKAFSQGLRRLLFFVPALVFVLAHFLVGNLIIKLLAQVHQGVMFVGGAILLFILMAWTRVYVSVIVRGMK